MKPNTIATTSIPSAPGGKNRGHSRFACTGRILLTASCASLVSFTTAIRALAQTADPSATYDVKCFSGTLRLNGNDLRIPNYLVKRIAGVLNSEVTVRDNDTIKLKKFSTIRIVEKVGNKLNLDVKASVTGPSFVRLLESGDTYSGKAAGAIITWFHAAVFGADISGKLKTRVSASVDGNTLTIVIRFYGDVEGQDFRGKVNIVAKR
jgi:hypothetical protein